MTPEAAAEAVRDMLKNVPTSAFTGICRSAADQIYERILYSVQDYLLDNCEHNIRQDIAYSQSAVEAARKEAYKVSLVNQSLCHALRNLVGNAGGLKVFESEIREIAGNTNWQCLMDAIALADEATAKALGETS
ncbi:hypothetical protein ACSMXM_05645 [Pacificimonas sp. ICDLI1SI03]